METNNKAVIEETIVAIFSNDIYYIFIKIFILLYKFLSNKKTIV
jgi:hypothetical protein